jgi:opacity protein-like surface antigen
MKSLVWSAVAAALLAPAATQAQSPQQKTELAARLLAIVKQGAQPNSGAYSVIGTATVGSQTKVYLQQEFDLSGKKRHVNTEYLCTLLDDGAGWMCSNANPSSQPGLMLVK